MDAGETDRRVSGLNEAERARGCPGKIDDTPPYERAAIVYPDDDGAAVAFVGDFDLGPERQAAMGRGHGVGIHALSGSGPASQGIPGCATALG